MRGEEIGSNGLSFVFTPKGLYPKAQGQHPVGCATLGNLACPRSAYVVPGCARRASRPRALGYNPFGVKTKATTHFRLDRVAPSPVSGALITPRSLRGDADAPSVCRTGRPRRPHAD